MTLGGNVSRNLYSTNQSFYKIYLCVHECVLQYNVIGGVGVSSRGSLQHLFSNCK